jgi:hypothetical protein
MSIEAMYPSRHQSRSRNPLFARKYRRQRVGAMLALCALGLGLLLLQIVPFHANAASVEVKSAPVAAVAPVKTVNPVSKTIRQIQIYSIAN